MKLIRRWGLMRSVQPENIQEHSQQVAVLAHALAEIDNCYCGGSSDAGRAVLLALYHDVGEVIIGDLPTPVKYFNPEINKSYGQIEDVAKDKLLSLLPKELLPAYQPLVFPDKTLPEYRLVKAADKLAAYIKCLEEAGAGNKEFAKAEKSIKKELAKYDDLPALTWFQTHCLAAYAKTLDELG